MTRSPTDRAPPPGERCPDDNELASWLDGLADERASQRLEDHIDRCPACADLVAELSRIMAPAEGRASEDGSPPAQMLGRYRVIGTLGAGGMGVVTMAHDPRLDRKVALKVVRPDLLATGDSDRLRAQLVREARLLASLSHPNVLTVFDVGTMGERLFLATEYVEGATLSDWIAEEEPSHDAVVDALVQAGRGLAAAHRAGLVHRDVKPTNLLVGRDGRVRVTDFGLATTTGDAPADGIGAGAGEPAVVPTATTATRTTSGLLVGTPAYMAPEQLAGGPADARSDQFSFCLTAYEALYGQRPFATNDAATVARWVASPEATGAGRPGVHARLSEALTRGLQPRPEDRHDGMDDVIAALEQALGSDGVTSPRARRLGLAWAAAAVVLAASAVAVWAPWSAPATDPAAVETRPRAQAPGEAARAVGSPSAGAATADAAGTATPERPDATSRAAPVEVPDVSTASPGGTRDADPAAASDAAESTSDATRDADPAAASDAEGARSRVVGPEDARASTPAKRRTRRRTRPSVTAGRSPDAGAASSAPTAGRSPDAGAASSAPTAGRSPDAGAASSAPTGAVERAKALLSAGKPAECLKLVQDACRAAPEACDRLGWVAARCEMRAGRCREGIDRMRQRIRSDRWLGRRGEMYAKASAWEEAARLCPSVDGLGPEVAYLRACRAVASTCGGAVKGKPWAWSPCREGSGAACLARASRVASLREALPRAFLRFADETCPLHRLRSAAICGAAAGQCAEGRRLYDRVVRLQLGREPSPEKAAELERRFLRSAPGCAGSGE